jgi:hypothetical protein
MYWRYFLYVCKHRWFVFLECLEVKLIWRGIIHDLSKFLPSEFKPYALYFFSVGPPTVNAAYKPMFDKAWLAHQHRNKHHWNHWVVDQFKQEAVQMPPIYIQEMLCDWRAMSRTFGGTIQEFYLKNKDKMIFHESTRKFIESELGIKEV